MKERTYTVPIASVAVGAVEQDVFEITGTDNLILTVEGLVLGQVSEFGDAADELLPVTIIAGHSNSGASGSSVTPVKINPYDPAASFSAERNNTTLAASGTTRTLYADAFNVRAGFFLPVPPYDPKDPFKGRIVLEPNERLVVRCGTAADTITWMGTLTIKEHPNATIPG